MPNGTTKWMPHGYGILYCKAFPNARYKGLFKMGQRHGYGVEHDYENYKYSGYWINNLREGPGEIVSDKGPDYGYEKAIWRQGNSHGLTFKIPKAHRDYDGELVKFKSIYDGRVDQGLRYHNKINRGMPNGFCHKQLCNGDKYTGMCRNSQMHGFGTYLKTDGTI